MKLLVLLLYTDVRSKYGLGATAIVQPIARESRQKSVAGRSLNVCAAVVLDRAALVASTNNRDGCKEFLTDHLRRRYL